MRKRVISIRDGRLPAVLLLALALLAVLKPATAQEPVLPQTRPDASAGLEIYAGRCASCHGPRGGGDGELAPNLPVRAAAFADPAFRQTVIPATLFGIITNGILEAGMPPFGPGSSNPLSDAARWDAVAAIYSLSTPPEVISQGQAIYQENCLACHGVAGAGDGPDAADLDTPPADLTNLAYWFNRSNETVANSLGGGRIPQHDYALNQDQVQAVVDYARTFSYFYADPAAPLAPIEVATISGQVTNGTTNEPVSGGAARLRGFTAEFQESLTLTTTIGTDGRYQFDLNQAPPDLIYLTSVSYRDLNFTSSAGQLNRAQPQLDLPVTVYEQTHDRSAISIEQLHLVLEFLEGRLQVSELYIFSNDSAAVFVGPERPEAGTVAFKLPTQAENVSFQRTFSSMDTFIPATEVVQTADGWADTLPLRPGRGTQNLLVNFEVPYQDGINLSHPLLYTARNVTVIMPDAGVRLEGEAWASRGAQQMPGGAFVSYAHPAIAAGDILSVNLSGRPQRVATAAGSVITARDQTAELVVGSAVLLAAALAAVFVVRAWRTPAVQPEDAPLTGNSRDAGDLLIAVAQLDNAYESGKLKEEEYRQRREALKAELRAVWSQVNGE